MISAVIQLNVWVLPLDVRMNALCECHKVSHSSCKQHIRTYVKIHSMYIRISTKVHSHLHTHLHTLHIFTFTWKFLRIMAFLFDFLYGYMADFFFERAKIDDMQLSDT